MISVIIPAYNAEETIAETIRSVVEQEDVTVEILVIDDGSTDDTADIVERFGPPVRLIRQENAGVGAARNRGIEEAAGGWVALVDADDLWERDKLSRQLAALEEPAPPAPDGACLPYGFCYTGVRLIDMSGEDFLEEIPWADQGPRPEGWIFRDLLLRGNTICTSSVIIRKEVLDRAGFFSSNKDESEDYDMWLRLARLAPATYLPTRLTRYRVLQESYYRAGDPSRARLRTMKTLDRAIQRWGIESASDWIALRRHRASILFAIAYELEHGQRIASRRWLVRSMLQHPLATRAGLHLLASTLPRAVQTWLRGLAKIAHR